MDITLPYLYKPRPYQLGLLRAMEKVKRAVIVWHRRSGKDKTCWNLIITKAVQRVGMYYYFAPTYSQGKKIIWDEIKDGLKMLDHIPEQLVHDKNNTEMKITLVNGSIIQLIGTDNIDTVVGTNPVGVVFTEYSLQSPKVWDLIRPILAQNGGWAVFNFTPRGMNHAFELLQTAKQSKDWFYEVLTVEDTHAIPDEVLDQEWQEMPEALYEQEYLCKFQEGASSVFKRVDQCVYDPKEFKLDKKRYYQMGVDLAKVNDYTVITPVDLTTFKVGKQERFNQIDWNLQKAKIEASYLRHFKPKTYMDSTGVGSPVYDDLVQQKITNLEPYLFTEKSRSDLLQNLQLLLEQGKIKIPNDPILLGELKSFQYELTPTGKVRMCVPENKHDDTVMSLALSVWNLPTAPLKEKGQYEKETLSQFDYHQRNKKIGGEIGTRSRYNF